MICNILNVNEIIENLNFFLLIKSSFLLSDLNCDLGPSLYIYMICNECFMNKKS